MEVKKCAIPGCDCTELFYRNLNDGLDPWLFCKKHSEMVDVCLFILKAIALEDRLRVLEDNNF